MSQALPLTRSVREHYDTLVAAGEIEADPAQLAIVARLDALNIELSKRRLASKKSALGWLFGKSRPASDDLRGLYIWGSVGRGKTMLMDLFFELAVTTRKRRAHFHEFMADVHERVHAVRQQIKSGALKGDDPIPPVAAQIAEETRLLCFDEFSVTDIADAMLLGRLFTRLFDAGVVVVATSNVEPRDLYTNGLNRGHFMPFIELLQQRVDVLRLDARADFRLEKLAGKPVYVTPLGEEADAEMDRLWGRLTNHARPRAERLEAQGRWIEVPRTAAGVARFTFDELCARPLGAADYLRLAHAYHTLMIDRIPALEMHNRNEAKRFINLIDALYDNRIKLVASAAAEPTELYRASSGVESFEFDRTASRLIEMRSEAYLSGEARD